MENLQINGVDLADARHDQAVSLLTGIDQAVTLVIYRERFVPKGSTPPQSTDTTPSRVQRLPHITQPVISWNQTSPGAGGASLALTPQPSSPGGSPSSASGMTTSSGLGSPGFSAAVPTSYTYLGQSSPTAGGTSPSGSLLTNGAMGTAESPKVVVPAEAKELSSEWTSPPSAVQPPKFVYPNYNRPSSTSSQVTTTTTTTTTTPSVYTPTSSVVVGHSLSFAPTPLPRTTENKESISSPGQTVSVSVPPAQFSNSVDSHTGVSDPSVVGVAQREQIRRLDFNHVQAGSPGGDMPSSLVTVSPPSPALDLSPQPYPMEVRERGGEERVS